MHARSKRSFHYSTDRMNRGVTILSHGWFPLTLQRTIFLQIREWRKKFSFHITHGHVFAFYPEKAAQYFQKAFYYTTDIFLPFFKYRRRKMTPLSKKRGHHDLRILRFERTASTAAVRTHGDFGSIPSPLHLAYSPMLRRYPIMNHSVPGTCFLHELQIKTVQHGADGNAEQHP